MNNGYASKKTGSANPPAPGELVSGTGTIVPGVECPRIEMDDGYAVSIQAFPPGTAGPPEPGTRVRVAGRAVLISTCMQGAAVTLESMDLLPG